MIWPHCALAAYPHMWCEEITIEYADNIALITECKFKLFGLLGIGFRSVKFVWNKAKETRQATKMYICFLFKSQFLHLPKDFFYLI